MKEQEQQPLPPNKKKDAQGIDLVAPLRRKDVKTFIGGFLGTLGYAFLRGEAQVRFGEEKAAKEALEANPDDAEAQEKLNELQDTLPLKARDQAIGPMTDKVLEPKWQSFLTEFGYSFFMFLSGMHFVTPIMDKFFPDKEQQQAEPEPKKPGGFLRDAVHYLIKYPLGAFAALVPFAMANQAFTNRTALTEDEKAAKEQAEAEGNEDPTPKWKQWVNQPLAKTQMQVGLTFATFNIAFRYVSKLTDKITDTLFGKAEEKKSEEPHDTLLAEQSEHENQQEKKQGNIFSRAWKEAKELVLGVATPVFISVMPLVGIFFFTNKGQKQAYEARINEKEENGADKNLWDHALGTGFGAGNLLNQTGEALFANGPVGNVLERMGLNEAQRKHVGGTMWSYSTAYAAYAMLRTHVEPAIRKVALGEDQAATPAQQSTQLLESSLNQSQNTLEMEPQHVI